MNLWQHVDTLITVWCKIHGVKTKALIELCGSVRAVRALWKPALSQSAVYQWGEDVPKLRVYQLRENHPNIEERIAAQKRTKARNGQRRAA